jgi:predicted ATP-dependent endonuclease of OLD family
MLIKGFSIRRFKSIEQVDVSLQSFGKGKKQSNTSILVGLNESGKSSILEAVNLWQEGLENISYDLATVHFF